MVPNLIPIVTRTVLAMAILFSLALCARPLGEGGRGELLAILDGELASGEKYVEERRRRIAVLHEMRSRFEDDSEQLFRIDSELYEEYLSFQFDSAYYYLNVNLDLARRMGDRVRETETFVKLGMLYTTAGMYLEALEVLTPLDTMSMSPALLIDYMATLPKI